MSNKSISKKIVGYDLDLSIFWLAVTAQYEDGREVILKRFEDHDEAYEYLKIKLEQLDKKNTS